MSEIIARRRFSLKQPTAFFVGTSAGIISLLALVGWGTGNVFLKSVQPDYASLKPNAAVGILLLGVGLAFAAASEKMRIVPRVLSAAAALIGLLTIIEHLTGFDAGIDAVLFADSIAAMGSPSAGRMAFAAALSLLLLGVSLMAARAKGRGTLLLVQSLTLAVLFIALITIIEYIYNVRLFQRVPILTTTALHAAFAFLLLSLGILHLVGNRGLTGVFWSEHPGGLLTRRLIPVIVIFPMLTGWVIFTLEREGYFPAPFALALFAGTTIISLSGLVWLTSLSIEKSEVERLEVKERLKDANRELEGFKFALDQSAIVVTTDTEGRITYVNDKFTQISGYSRKEAIGKTHRLVNSGHHPAEFFGEMWKTITQGQIWRGEICNKTKNGKILWMDATIVPLVDKDGRPEKFFAIRFDVTARKLAEEKVAESESRYRLLFENNPYPMWVYNAENLAFLAVNDAAVEHYGYSKKEFLSMRITDIRPPEDVPALLENVANTKTVIDNAGVWRHLRKDGSIILVEIKSHELNLDGVLARLVLAHDVTERIGAEKNLRESEERYRALASSAQMVWLADPNGVLKRPAENWTEITGLQVSDAPDEWWLEGVHPDDRKFTLRQWRNSMTTKEVFEVENRVRSADGGYRWFYSRGVPVINRNGTVREWVGMTLDIEKRKTAEAELQELNEQLEQRIANRTRELEAVNKELESFSYSVSHDLRAPLRAMDGFSQVLAEDYGGKLDSTGLDYLNRVCSASRKMARLIDDLLMLSRISRKELNRVTVNLSELANLILREWMEAEPDRLVDCSIQDGVFANCDENLARVALENLLSNSWKFTSKKERAEIAFGTENSGGFSEIYVRDNGAGFDMAFADKLFGAFQRLHSEAEFPGTGIGLATVKRIITLHGGSIRSLASPDNGASFFFTFEQF